MKFLITGLGSMGKRRARCLLALGYQPEDIIGFDLRADRRDEAADKYGIATYARFEEAIAEKPTAHIISLPPDLHMDFALLSIQHGLHFFTEASVVDDGVEDMLKKLDGSGLVAAPSCTLRFYPLMKRLKQLVDDQVIGKITSMTFHCGEYLPDWHPYEDIKDYYVGKRETGGAREIVPFELVWMVWMFGDVQDIVAFKGKQTSLDVDIDDTYQVLLRFAENQMLGHMQIDVVARTLVRNGRLLSEQGIIEWDYTTNSARVFQADTREWTVYDESFERNEGYYEDEMRAFVAAIKHEQTYPYTFEEDLKCLNWLVEAEINGVKIQHGNA